MLGCISCRQMPGHASWGCLMFPCSPLFPISFTSWSSSWQGRADTGTCIAQAHGWVATIGLGVLLPLGIVLAKLFKSSRAWRAIFWVHVLVQVSVLHALQRAAGTSILSLLLAGWRQGRIPKAVTAMPKVITVDPAASLQIMPCCCSKQFFLCQVFG